MSVNRSRSVPHTCRENCSPSKAKVSSSRRQRSSIVCCTSDSSTDVFDLCPRNWYCSENSSGSREYRRLGWHLCFLACCLPCCYTCYLTRTIRRALGLEPQIEVEREEQEDEDIFNRTSSSLNRAMFRQTSLWRPTQTIQRTEETLPNSALRHLTISVLLLNSELSSRVEQVLSVTRDGEEESDHVIRVVSSNKTSIETCKNEGQRIDSDPENIIEAEQDESNAAAAAEARASNIAKENKSIPQKLPIPSITVSEMITVSVEPVALPDGEELEKEPKSDEVVSAISTSQDTFVSANRCDSSEVVRRDNSSRFVVRGLTSVRHSLSMLGRPVRRVARRVTHLNFASSPMQKPLAKPLGTWSELVEELGYNVNFVVFNEEAVGDLSADGPAIDLILLAIKKGSMSDIERLTATTSGVMGNLRRFWTGFHPVLVVELEEENDQAIIHLEAYESCLRSLLSLFGASHRISLSEAQMLYSAPWITECLARLFIHTRLYLCPTFVEDDGHDKCPGGCGLSRNYEAHSRGDHIDSKENRRRAFTLFKDKPRESVYMRSKRVSKF